MAKKVKKDKKSKSLDEYLDILELDPFSLDDEWVGQPSLYGRFAAELAEARKEHEEAKADLKVVRADLGLQMRADPDSFDIPKSTEGAISDAITVHDEHVKATKRTINAQYRADLLTGVVTALDHRKRALEKLVDLRLSDYFSEPRAKKLASREAMEKAADKKTFGRRKKGSK